jgi:hypothetical protein
MLPRRSPRFAAFIATCFLIAAIAPAVAQGASPPVKAAPSAPIIGPPPLPDEVESIVTATQFASSYAGESVHPDGTVTVYVTAAGRKAISAALAAHFAAPGTPAVAPAPYDLQVVPRSAAQLDALTQRLAADETSLATAGVKLVTWGPDPQSGTVQATVESDPAAAQRIFDGRYGAGTVSVSSTPALALPVRTSNRYYDGPPFYNGDRIFMDNNTGNKCTDAFAFKGNNSGKIFGITAGHCGGSSIWTNLSAHYEMGPISTRYFSNNGWDLESFTCNCAGPVWYEGPGIGTGQGYTHHVIGSCYCGTGQLVATDGASTGEVPDTTVGATNVCVTFEDGVTTCHLDVTSKANTVICQGGDSGGPVYQRAPNNNVYAVGVIIGEANFGNTCYYHPYTSVLGLVNGTIVTG